MNASPSVRLALFLLLLAGVLAPAGSARGADEPWRSGDRITAFELADAHGEPGRVDEAVRLVLFTADMDAGKIVAKALEDASLQDLAAHGAVYVADISRMPAVISQLFAMPSIRRRPYRTLLDSVPEATLRIPREEGKVTLLRLDALEVRAVELTADAGAVAAALRGADAPAP